MVPLLIRYPLDETGKNPNNLVADEPHDLTPNRTFRAIAPLYGAFFQESLVVVDAATGQTLTDGTNGTVEQYYACEYYEVPSSMYGKEIDAIIIIKDPSVSNSVRITYQALGGPWGTSAQAIVQQIAALGLDNRPVAWGDILGKPSQFAPTQHLHDIGDIYGFEYVVFALDRVRDAILVGDQAAHDEIYRYIDNALQGFNTSLGALQQQLTNHINDQDNPHKTTAAQTNAPDLPTFNQVTGAIQNALNNHIGDTNNPHKTTVAELNTYDGPTIDQKIATAVSNAALPFTPVQQGGAANQGTTKIQIGNNTSGSGGLRANMGGSDLGLFIFDAQFNSTVATLNQAISQKAPIRPDYAYLGADVSFNSVTTSFVNCSNDIWAFSSDGRLKMNFEKIPDALKRIKQLSGYLYHFRPEHIAKYGVSDRQQLGLIAQEVQKVAPWVVGPAQFDLDENGNSISGHNYLTVQYDKLVALIIEATKQIAEHLEEVAKQASRAEGGLIRIAGHLGLEHLLAEA